MGFADFGIYTLMTLLGIAVVLVFTMLNAAYLTYYERKVMGHMQARVGPMHTGPHGLLQPLADGLKLFFKEDIIPAKADRKVFVLAPLMALVPAFVAYAVVPFGPEMTIFGHTIHLYVTDLNIGILYVLALSSLGAYGIIMAGWSSNSKYALMGGLRSASQVISYEIPMGLAIISVLMMTGSLSLVDITKGQAHLWNIAYQPVAFIIYMISGIAETNRAPFDLPEAENELVAGFHVEYSGYALRVFLHGGICEHAHGLVHGGGALPGRLEPHNPARGVRDGADLRAVPGLPWRPGGMVVHHQDIRLLLHVPLDQGDSAEASVRPAHEAWVEDTDPDRAFEHTCYRTYQDTCPGVIGEPDFEGFRKIHKDDHLLGNPQGDEAHVLHHADEAGDEALPHREAGNPARVQGPSRDEAPPGRDRDVHRLRPLRGVLPDRVHKDKDLRGAGTQEEAGLIRDRASEVPVLRVLCRGVPGKGAHHDPGV